MIKLIFFKTVQRIINHALSLDSDKDILLKPLQNKPLSLILEDWKLNLTFIPKPDCFELSTDKHKLAPTKIIGSTADLLPLIFSNNPQADMMKSGVSIEGQIAVLNLYQTFFNQLDINWEQQLSQKIGPAAARAIFLPLKKAKKIAKIKLNNLKQDVPEWLQEEAKLLPHPDELEHFYDDIAQLRQRVERVEHLERLR